MPEGLLEWMVTLMTGGLAYFLRSLHQDFAHWKQHLTLFQSQIKALEVEMRSLHKLMERRLQDQERYLEAVMYLEHKSKERRPQ